MNFLWISGWAIPPAWLAKQAQAAWPQDTHVAVSPSDASRALTSERFDALGGYSLGALWLLQHAHTLPANVPVTLLAPILAFPSEAGAGGRVSLTQLKVQRRNLRRDAAAAVIDFLRRAGLDEFLLPHVAAELTPARLAELNQELDWLETWHPPVPTAANWRAFVGDHDPLLDAAALQRHWPRVQVVVGATHAPGLLLRAMAGVEPRPPLSHLPQWEGAVPPAPLQPIIPAPDVVRSFDRAADGYDSHALPQAALAATLASWIAPAERHGRALEFGAGTGAFTRLMQPWNGTYLATDAAPRMIARGRAGCPGAQWQEARADEPGLAPVDWIFACGLLHWMPDPAGILRGWRSLLAPGGQLAVTIFLGETLKELQSLLPQAPSPPWRTVEAWQQLLADAGFALTQTAERRDTTTHPSARDLLRSVHAMGVAPHRAIGPGKLRAALRTYDQRFATNGGVRATWHAWLARAVAV